MPRDDELLARAISGEVTKPGGGDPRLAGVSPRANPQIERYRAQLTATARRHRLWEALSHPVVVAVSSLTVFSAMAMLWWPLPPIPDAATANAPVSRLADEPMSSLATATATPAPSVERPVGTSGAMAPVVSSSALAAPLAAHRSFVSGAAIDRPERVASPAVSSASTAAPVPVSPEPAALATAAVPAAALTPWPVPTPPAPVTPAAWTLPPDMTAQQASPEPSTPPVVHPAAPPDDAPLQVHRDDQATTAAAPAAVDVQPPVAAPGQGATRDAQLVTGPLPRSPESVKRIGQVDAVDVEVTIDRKGQVVRAEAVDGPRLLRGFAEKAVMKWRYEPAVSNGVAVESRRRVRILFR